LLYGALANANAFFFLERFHELARMQSETLLNFAGEFVHSPGESFRA
jgi:hypothetical protein